MIKILDNIARYNRVQLCLERQFKKLFISNEEKFIISWLQNVRNNYTDTVYAWTQNVLSILRTELYYLDQYEVMEIVSDWIQSKYRVYGVDFLNEKAN